MLPNQVTRRMGLLMIIRQNQNAPSEQDWDETLRLMTLNPAEMDRLKVLVVTDGGGPTPEQRKRLDRAMSGKPVRTAVVSESVKVRFIVSSVALLTAKIQSFRKTEMEQAFKFLDLDTKERLQALQNVAEMDLLVAPVKR
jgi:D-ribose pyranose/furanose isomerase RbsD